MLEQPDLRVLSWGFNDRRWLPDGREVALVGDDQSTRVVVFDGEDRVEITVEDAESLGLVDPREALVDLIREQMPDAEIPPLPPIVGPGG